MAFWRDKSLNEMTIEEWESLCDGCGKCCLHKLEDEDTGVVYYTSVACRLLDLEKCRCSQYFNRTTLVPECVDIKRMPRDRFGWLPSTCAYRLLADGEDLPAWHPLVSGKNTSVIDVGASVMPFAVPESQVTNFEDHIIEWLD